MVISIGILLPAELFARSVRLLFYPARPRRARFSRRFRGCVDLNNKKDIRSVSYVLADSHQAALRPPMEDVMADSFKLFALMSSTALVALTSPAVAQEAAPAPQSRATAPADDAADIIVTANKRE